jgi:hypothetical protein
MASLTPFDYFYSGPLQPLNEFFRLHEYNRRT